MATRFDTSYEHTFLLADGVWEARGRALAGPDANEALVTGTSNVRVLGGGHIAVDSVMTVQAGIPFEVRQRYTITRTPTAERLTVVSRNDRIGELIGEMWLLGDSIQYHYASAKGRFRGGEWLRRRTPDHYTAIGHFVADGRAQIVWEVDLRRVLGGAPID
jgi:hypothetical protein